jgi:hypothetical protein
MVQTHTFRAPSQTERGILSRLIEADFPGRDQLEEQLANAIVRSIDEDGSLEIKADSGPSANVIKRVPVEAEAADSDGVPIQYLLHVVDGRAIELDVWKGDGTPIKRPPEPKDLRVIVLPS